MGYVTNDRVWGSDNFYIMRVLSLMLMVMCEDSPDDTIIYKSTLERRADSVFGCQRSRYVNTTAQCSYWVNL